MANDLIEEAAVQIDVLGPKPLHGETPTLIPSFGALRLVREHFLRRYLKPRRQQLRGTYGTARARRKQFNEERCEGGNPSYAEAYNALGVIDQRLGALDRALQALEKAIAIRPGYSEAHNNRGSVLQDLGRMDEAISTFEMAIIHPAKGLRSKRPQSKPQEVVVVCDIIHNREAKWETLVTCVEPDGE